MKYWEIIANNLNIAGWSWGCVSVVDSRERTIWIVDAQSRRRHDQVNAMLLNEFLREHRKVQKLETDDAEQQREIKALAATVKASDQLPATRVV